LTGSGDNEVVDELDWPPGSGDFDLLKAAINLNDVGGGELEA
jgi:hypothetical protein